MIASIRVSRPTQEEEAVAMYLVVVGLKQVGTLESPELEATLLALDHVHILHVP
jgi:hypothetical protein